MLLTPPTNRKEIERLNNMGAEYDEKNGFWFIGQDKFSFEMQNFMKLSIDVMPVGNDCWKGMMYNYITEDQYSSIRKSVNAENGYKCCICGGRGAKWLVEMHEDWDYVERAAIQRLKGLCSLCPECHRVKHILTDSTDYRVEKGQIKHFMKINECTYEEFKTYLYMVRKKRKSLLKKEWVPDINYLCRLLQVPLIAEELYEGEEKRKILNEVLGYAVCEKQLLDSQLLQKKLVNYAKNEMTNNNPITGLNAIRLKMLAEKMKYNLTND